MSGVGRAGDHGERAGDDEHAEGAEHAGGTDHAGGTEHGHGAQRPLRGHSDAELRRLAYGRDTGATDALHPTPDALRAAAAAELALRTPPAPARTSTASAVPPPPTPSRWWRRASRDQPSPRQGESDAGRPDAESRETAPGDRRYLDNTHDETDLDEADAHPGRRRTLTIGAIIVAAVAITVITLDATRQPAAFAVFEADPTAQDVADEDRLRALGEPLYDGARVLDRLALETADGPTGETLRLVGFRRGVQGAPASSRQVCAVVLSESRQWGRTCVAEEDFGEGGFSAGEDLPGARLTYRWTGEGESSVRLTATGPTTLDEVGALDLPAFDLLAASLDAPRDPVLTTVMAAVRPSGEPTVRLGPTLLTTGDAGWILIAELTDSPTPTGELQVCLTATRLGIAAAPIDHRCSTVSDFVDRGLGSDPGPGVGPVSFEWRANNEVRLDVLPSGRP